MECMYPDTIKTYTTEEQFIKHRQMLKELTAYFEDWSSESSHNLYNLQKEHWLLEKHYYNWKKKQEVNHEEC